MRGPHLSGKKLIISMERSIYLIRHGRPDLPDQELRFLGTTDLPLSREGIRQAQKLRLILEGRNFERVFHSGMKRASQTAEIIFENRSIDLEVMPEFREIAFGEWENLPMREISLKDPAAFKARGEDFANFTPPGGENFTDLQKRTFPAFEKILSSSSGDVIIVGHAGVFKSIILRILGLPLQQLFSFRLDYCGISLIYQKDQHLSMNKLNWTPEI
ncbi:MAG TPA: histidine phosphatase family protein [Synergistales bacterium]|nr:histidine phosphatase family protein [Synergistales bacterium]